MLSSCILACDAGVSRQHGQQEAERLQRDRQTDSGKKVAALRGYIFLPFLFLVPFCLLLYSHAQELSSLPTDRP